MVIVQSSSSKIIGEQCFRCSCCFSGITISVVMWCGVCMCVYIVCVCIYILCVCVFVCVCVIPCLPEEAGFYGED
jgi:hypothetical protein